MRATSKRRKTDSPDRWNFLAFVEAINKSNGDGIKPEQKPINTKPLYTSPQAAAALDQATEKYKQAIQRLA